MRWLVIGAAVLTLLVCVAPARAYPGWWKHEAACVHRHEGGWHETTTWAGAPSRDRGGYQIDVATWTVFAPYRWPRDPAAATPAQQTLVAWRIWRRNGRRWGAQWPNSSRACGVA